MYMTSVAVLPDSELYQDVMSGKFREATEKERIEETLLLVKELKNPIVLYGQSVANPVNFIARLPEQSRLSLAQLMIKENEPIDKIERYTGYTQEKIEEIADMLEHI